MDKTFTPDPLAGQLGDGVNDPSSPLLTGFPFVGIPHRGFDYNTAVTEDLIRCGTGGIFNLNPDMTLNTQLTNPVEIEGRSILTASASFPVEAIRAICGSQFK